MARDANIISSARGLEATVTPPCIALNRLWLLIFASLCKKSLSGNFQRGVDGRVVRAALYRLGVVMRDFSP